MYYFDTRIEIPYRLSPLEELALAADDEILPDELVEVEVEVGYAPGYFSPGRYSGPPEHCYPDEGEDPEILFVRNHAGRELLDDLSSSQVRALTAEAWEHQTQSEADARADAQIAAHEDRMFGDEGIF